MYEDITILSVCVRVRVCVCVLAHDDEFFNLLVFFHLVSLHMHSSRLGQINFTLGVALLERLVLTLSDVWESVKLSE